MKNRIIGAIVIIIALLVGILTYSFSSALNKIHSETCLMGKTCTANQAIEFQTTSGIIFFSLLVLVGLYLIFFGQEKVEIIKKIREKVKRKDYNNILKTLTAEERKILMAVISEQGAIFQSDLAEKTGFDKVKVSRILDKLEGRQIIERRRRGMTNIVILKQ